MDQNYWVHGRYQSFGILDNRKHVLRKLDLFPSSDEERKTHALLGLLESANLSQRLELASVQSLKLVLFNNPREYVDRNRSMKNVVFWDVTPCGSCNDRSFRRSV
jgi:hypothetical protein